MKIIDYEKSNSGGGEPGDVPYGVASRANLQSKFDRRLPEVDGFFKYPLRKIDLRWVFIILTIPLFCADDDVINP
ncbi:MAG: hypothetical protein Q8O89_01150 [Nanoarchaeota archaeon]|nr:hypothetical protein [Nanoarchaeota archaeon]